MHKVFLSVESIHLMELFFLPFQWFESLPASLKELNLSILLDRLFIDLPRFNIV